AVALRAGLEPRVVAQAWAACVDVTDLAHPVVAGRGVLAVRWGAVRGAAAEQDREHDGEGRGNEFLGTNHRTAHLRGACRLGSIIRDNNNDGTPQRQRFSATGITSAARAPEVAETPSRHG